MKVEVAALLQAEARGGRAGIPLSGADQQGDLDLDPPAASVAICGALELVQALLKSTEAAAATAASSVDRRLGLDPDLARTALQGRWHRPPTQNVWLRDLNLYLSRYLLAGPYPLPATLPASWEVLWRLLALSLPPLPSYLKQQRLHQSPQQQQPSQQPQQSSPQPQHLSRGADWEAIADWASREQRALVAVELLVDVLSGHPPHMSGTAAGGGGTGFPLLAPRLLLVRRFPALPQGWAGAAPWASRLGEDDDSETTLLRLVLELSQPLWRVLQAQHDAVDEAMLSASELPLSYGY